MDFHEKPLVKASNVIIQNKENITNFEKKTLKCFLLIALLAYLVYTNITTQDDTGRNKRMMAQQELDAVDSPKNTGISAFFSVAVLKDCSKELIMLFMSVGGYVLMAKINNWLDTLE